MSKVRAEQTLNLLTKEYGSRKWQPRHDPLSVLVQTILSQHTSDTNSRRAFESLITAFGSWEKVAAADVDQIFALIKVGGLGKIKASRIKQMLSEIKRKRGKIELSFLDKLPLAEAREWLKQLPGVGTKTANCVLLFSFGRPALPVDTHVFRVARRLEMVSSPSVEQAHELLEGLVTPGDVYQFHVLMIEHGRRICQSQHPHCLQCVLRALCPSSDKFVDTSKKGMTPERVSKI